MSLSGVKSPFVAIACGGTGGHLFPGLAVAGQLQKRGCAVALLISPKEVDQQGVKAAHGMEVHTLPAVALQNRNYLSFARSFWRSWRVAKKFFKARPPQAVLAMGGFTSASPILAGNSCGAKTFLHESNTIPGRANRFLARRVNEAFVGFPEAASRFKAGKITATGTPVRSQFHPRAAAECRAALGLDPDLTTILVTGGSQGATGLNELILSTLPLLVEKNWQWLHLTGANDFERAKMAHAAAGNQALVKPFLAEMELALGAATVCVSRSGASSLAEIAAVRLPSLLVPYPAAADNHQFFNGSAFEKTGAARLLEQKAATSQAVAAILSELVEDEAVREKMRSALVRWQAPQAAEQIAQIILDAITQPKSVTQTVARQGECGPAHASAKHAH